MIVLAKDCYRSLYKGNLV
uniref:Uncharacterized protein n=1 Tax=Arundo donax TaxID=35708 RepID=A0A0A8ZVE9_ARUDO